MKILSRVLSDIQYLTATQRGSHFGAAAEAYLLNPADIGAVRGLGIPTYKDFTIQQNRASANGIISFGIKKSIILLYLIKCVPDTQMAYTQIKWVHVTCGGTYGMHVSCELQNGTTCNYGATKGEKAFGSRGSFEGTGFTEQSMECFLRNIYTDVYFNGDGNRICRTNRSKNKTDYARLLKVNPQGAEAVRNGQAIADGYVPGQPEPEALPEPETDQQFFDELRAEQLRRIQQGGFPGMFYPKTLAEGKLRKLAQKRNKPFNLTQAVKSDRRFKYTRKQAASQAAELRKERRFQKRMELLAQEPKTPVKKTDKKTKERLRKLRRFKKLAPTFREGLDKLPVFEDVPVSSLRVMSAPAKTQQLSPERGSPKAKKNLFDRMGQTDNPEASSREHTIQSFTRSLIYIQQNPGRTLKTHSVAEDGTELMCTIKYQDGIFTVDIHENGVFTDRQEYKSVKELFSLFKEDTFIDISTSFGKRS